MTDQTRISFVAKLKASIALASLRCLLPKGTAQAQQLVVLPLHGSGLLVCGDQYLADLLQAEQIVIREGHPIRIVQPLSQSLGSVFVQLPSNSLRTDKPANECTATEDEQP